VLAGEAGVDLVWCMATPADLVLAASLEHVVAVRTSDDYRFAADPAILWTWYLTVNRLAAALGLRAFKDCFFSAQPPEGGGDAIDGDPHAEVEALLACMSAGPVGIDNPEPTSILDQLESCGVTAGIRRVAERPAVCERAWWISPEFETHPVTGIDGVSYDVGAEARPAFLEPR